MFSNISVFAHILHLGHGTQQVIVTLAFNDNHIIYYYMDAQQSIGLVQAYFPSPDYFIFSVGSIALSFILILLIRQFPISITILSSLRV